jgi:hypothetical protein
MAGRQVNYAFVAAAILFAAASARAGQEPATPHNSADRELFERILDRDTEQFSRFNAHDLTGFMSFFADDLEFYHDKDGLLSRSQVTAGFERLFARNDGLRRDLVPGTLEVYPIPGYGAVEIGSHRMCHVENGQDDCGVFRFVQVWKNTGGNWKVTRILSYAH